MSLLREEASNGYRGFAVHGDAALHSWNTSIDGRGSSQWLQEHAMRYWTEQGIEVVATEQVDIGGEDTYKIYELSSNDAKPGLINLMEADCEAILISGTGMPSLRLIAEFNQPSKKIISSNYAMTIIGLSYLGLKPKKQTEWFS